MSICAVKWCLAEAVENATVCVVHKALPSFAPEELDAKEGHFEAKAEWVEQECDECGGDGVVDHECDCERCLHESDDCEYCGGDGTLATCSLCGYQASATYTSSDKKTHEEKCWQPAQKPVERTA